MHSHHYVFSDPFKKSGVGPVYVIREFPSNPCSDNRIQLYEVGPPELSHIIGDDPYSGFRGGFVGCTFLPPPDLKQIFPEAEAAAIHKWRRLDTVLDNLNSLAWRQSLSASRDHMSDGQRASLNEADDNAAKKHRLVLAEISQLEKAFPILISTCFY